MNELQAIIVEEADKLKGTLRYTTTWLMWEVMSAVEDWDLEDWGVDIVEVADMVLTYYETGKFGHKKVTV